jgi:hypothetical protein
VQANALIDFDVCLTMKRRFFEAVLFAGFVEGAGRSRSPPPRFGRVSYDLSPIAIGTATTKPKTRDAQLISKTE